MTASLRDRLYARVIPDPETGCLLWQGYTNHGGYGMIRAAERPYMVHRVAWELQNGPIPDGLTIDHVYDRGCRNKNCVNVAHLELVTQAENTRRWKRRVTHCPQGHAYDETNTYVYRGSRYCRTCLRARSRIYNRRRRAAA